VDLSDFILVDNNNMNYVSQTTPLGVPPETLDYTGQTYHTVLIGTQYWLKEILNVGTKIFGSTVQSNNGIIEKYCYDNLAANCITYGGLYQWNETMQYSASGCNIQGICPSGWHILPLDAELSTLSSAVSGDGNPLKAIGQGVNNGTGSDTSGFSALLTGYRLYNAGTFSDLGIEGMVTFGVLRNILGQMLY
jgi:uncharacterized protein (TIGR02145 family)